MGTWQLGTLGRWWRGGAVRAPVLISCPQASVAVRSIHHHQAGGCRCRCRLVAGALPGAGAGGLLRTRQTAAKSKRLLTPHGKLFPWLALLMECARTLLVRCMLIARARRDCTVPYRMHTRACCMHADARGCVPIVAWCWLRVAARARGLWRPPYSCMRTPSVCMFDRTAVTVQAKPKPSRQCMSRGDMACGMAACR